MINAKELEKITKDAREDLKNKIKCMAEPFLETIEQQLIDTAKTGKYNVNLNETDFNNTISYNHLVEILEYIKSYLQSENYSASFNISNNGNDFNINISWDNPVSKMYNTR